MRLDGSVTPKISIVSGIARKARHALVQMMARSLPSANQGLQSQGQKLTSIWEFRSALIQHLPAYLLRSLPDVANTWLCCIKCAGAFAAFAVGIPVQPALGRLQLPAAPVIPAHNQQLSSVLQCSRDRRLQGHVHSKQHWVLHLYGACHCC